MVNKSGLGGFRRYSKVIKGYSLKNEKLSRLCRKALLQMALKGEIEMRLVYDMVEAAGCSNCQYYSRIDIPGNIDIFTCSKDISMIGDKRVTIYLTNIAHYLFPRAAHDFYPCLTFQEIEEN